MASNIRLSPKGSEGGLGKTSLRYFSLPTIDLQCLACRLEMEGSRGSYVIANTGLFVFFSMFLFFRAACLGTFLAFSIAELTAFSEYPLSKSWDLSSSNLMSLFFGSEQILTILSPKDFGMAAVVCFG